MTRGAGRVAAPSLILLAIAGCGARSDLPGVAPASPGSADSIVLFGGSGTEPDGGDGDLGDTWLWSPSGGWTEVHPPVSPSPRSDAMAASLGGEVVLFGGDGQVPETWTWDGKTWAQQHPSSPPPPLTDSVFTPFGQSLLLFGGYDYGTLYHDVWQWDGTSWTHEAPSTTPPAREAPAGAVIGGSLVVFGGEDTNLLPIGDTWVFDGSSWTQVTPAHAPSPRRGAVAAAYDGKMVLFGGDTLPDPLGTWVSVNETWVWDGADWTQMAPAESPPARSFAAMAVAGGKLVLFGGTTFGGPIVDPPGTWTWDGTTWTQEKGPEPSARSGPAMAAR